MACDPRLLSTQIVLVWRERIPGRDREHRAAQCAHVYRGKLSAMDYDHPPGKIETGSVGGLDGVLVLARLRVRFIRPGQFLYASCPASRQMLGRQYPRDFNGAEVMPAQLDRL